MDITTNREVIWERIKAGGPTSIIVSNNEKIDFVTSKILIEYEKEITSSNFIPVCIDCADISDSIIFFKTLFYTIWEALSIGDNAMTEFKEDIDHAKDTSLIDAIMENFLPIVKTNLNQNFLLILEDFDKAVSCLEEPDLMKVRGMSSHINMLTFSYKPLEMLATEYQKEDYYCNQFKSFYV